MPSFTPTNLTVLHKNATSITISWTAVDATDADGYAVYYGGYAADVGNASELIGAESDQLSVETRQSELNTLIITIIMPCNSFSSCSWASEWDISITTYKFGSNLSCGMYHSICCVRTHTVDCEWYQHYQQYSL